MSECRHHELPAVTVTELITIHNRLRLRGLTADDLSWLEEVIGELASGHVNAAESLLKTARRCGVDLRANDDGSIGVSGPAWPSLLDGLRAHRLEVIELLRGEHTGSEQEATRG